MLESPVSTENASSASSSKTSQRRHTISFNTLTSSRASTSRASTSSTNSFNPPPKKYRRSQSVSSVTFFRGSVPEVEPLPIFNQDATDEAVQQFLADTLRVQESLKRTPIFKKAFRYIYLFMLVLVVYFLLVGAPLWTGFLRLLVTFFHEKSALAYGALLFLSWGAFLSWIPLLCCRFEPSVDDVEKRDASQVTFEAECRDSAPDGWWDLPLW